MLTLYQDNLYSNEVSFHDLNLLHDHADLAGPLRIRVGCNPRRFITRYRELKSKLEQLNLLDEATADDGQFRDQDERTYFISLMSSHCSIKPAGDLTEQPDAKGVPEYPAQDEEGYEDPTSEGFDQAVTEHPTDDAGPDVHTVDHFDEGELSVEVEPEQAQPAGDEEYDVGPLSGDEHTERPAGVAEGDPERGAATVTASDNGDPGSAEDLDASAVHEHSDVHDTQPLGDSADYGEVAVTDQDYEADYNENGQDSEFGETVAIEGDARDGDWETTVSEVQQTHDDLEQHEGEADAAGTDKCEEMVHITIADGLTPPSTDSDTTGLTAPGLDDDPTVVQQGTWPPSTIVYVPSNFIVDTDTDSIGQQTLDEFVDAQEESRDDHRSHEEEEESNDNAGRCLFPASSPLRLTQPLDQSNGLIPGLDQFGDDFNWDEDFGGDFDDGELGEFDEQSKVETKGAGSREPISGRSSKRAYDEISSDTADEEEAQGDISLSKFLSTPSVLSKTHVDY